MFTKITQLILQRSGLALFLVALVAALGWHSRKTTSIDAIPNIGRNQVIVLTKWPGQSPKDVEDQVTYPLSVAMLAVPRAESVRGKSLFGFSFVQITFPDDTDYYWARSRVSEQLTTVTGELPAGAKPVMGPDSTGLGQIFIYVLQPDRPSNPTKLRTLQDYVVRYALQSVDGVSEVASIGGYKREYQVDLDPDKLRFHKVPLRKVIRALRESNTEVGAKTIEQSDMEFIIRGKGFLGGGKGAAQTTLDLESAVVSSTEGVPLRIKDLADVRGGTGFRRGGLDLNGAEAVGGIVVMRLGENPRAVIDRLKERIKRLEPSLDGVRIVPIYDRTVLIDETVATLSDALLHEILITILVIILFLLHVRTSLIVASVLPLSVWVTFIFMRQINLDANIMSLAGIAIAIGNMVDMGIVIAENIYQRLTEKRPTQPEQRLGEIAGAVGEVMPALLTATITTVISFLPVFLLTGRDYKLFAPLAMTKTFAILSALMVSMVVIPLLARFILTDKTSETGRKFLPVAAALAGAAIFFQLSGTAGSGTGLAILLAAGGGVAGWFAGRFLVREPMRPVEQNPFTGFIHRMYEPLLRRALRRRRLITWSPVILLLIGLFAWHGIRPVLAPVDWMAGLAGYDVRTSPFFRTLRQAMPGLKSDDWIALDEGSFFYMPTMYPGISFTKAFEILQTQDTLIKEIPEVENVLGKIGRADSALDPAPTAMVETYVMLKDKSAWRPGMTATDIWQEITRRATLPGVTPASFLQPIEGRVVMLQSGIKASMAIRIYGDTLQGLAEAAKAIATHLRTVPVINPATVNPDLVLGKPYVEFDVDRQTAARFGMSVGDVNTLIATALGGKTVGYTVEGRERYPIRLRYMREYRDHLERLGDLPVVTTRGEAIPLKVLATMRTIWGPAGISSENARLVAHVAFAPSGVAGALETVDEVMQSLREAGTAGTLSLPPGYDLEAVGSFQNQLEANRTLAWVIPLVIITNLFIIWLMFKRWALSLTIFSGIPLAFGGGMILLLMIGIEINTAIWVGFIAVFGIAVDNGVILTAYLRDRFASHPPASPTDIIENVVHAGLKRVRPCLMTTTTTLIALLPILFASGKGSEVARGMALPLFGGMFSALLVLLVVPVVYAGLEEQRFRQSAPPDDTSTS